MTKKTVEEVGAIFLEESKKLIDDNIEELSACVDANLNKAADSKKKYDALLQKFKDKLPARGVTQEEFNDFLPHIIDYQVDLIPYIVQKINPQLFKKEDQDD
jgi:hypothetical protein